MRRYENDNKHDANATTTGFASVRRSNAGAFLIPAGHGAARDRRLPKKSDIFDFPVTAGQYWRPTKRNRVNVAANDEAVILERIVWSPV